MIKDLKVQIASDIDYENLIAEIYKKDQLIAIVSQEIGPEKLVIEFPQSANKATEADFDWLIEALQIAKNKLLAN